MNTYTAARRRWELKQEELHGCRYADRECVAHGTTAFKTQTPPESANTVEFPLICNCRSFDCPHTLDAHDVLESPFDWRTAQERHPMDENSINPPRVPTKEHEAGSGDWRAKMEASPVTTSELLMLAGESDEHTWNGTRPDGVALVFEQELVDVVDYRPDGGVALAIQQELVLISGGHPVTPQQAQFYLREFPAPRWAFFGHVFSYTDPQGGTFFRGHPHPALGEERWNKHVLDLPVFTDLVQITYREKIFCRLMRVSYEDCLAQEGRAQCSPEMRKFSGPDAAAAALQFFRDRVAENPCRCGPASFDGYCQADFPPDELPEMGIFVDMNMFFTDSVTGGTRGDPEEFAGLMGKKTPFAVFCGRCLHVFCVCQRQGDRHSRQSARKAEFF